MWRIPFSDLIAAGLVDKVKSSPEEMADTRATALEITIDNLERELRLTKELLDEVRADRDFLRSRMPAQLETKQAQDQRRFSWFRRNP